MSQAERMRADLGLSGARQLPSATMSEPMPAQLIPRERTSLVIEALACLGGVIVLVAAGLLAAQYWPHMR